MATNCVAYRLTFFPCMIVPIQSLVPTVCAYRASKPASPATCWIGGRSPPAVSSASGIVTLMRALRAAFIRVVRVCWRASASCVIDTVRFETPLGDMSTHLPMSVESVGLEQELICAVDDCVAVFLHGGSNREGVDNNGVNWNRACIVPGSLPLPSGYWKDRVIWSAASPSAPRRITACSAGWMLKLACLNKVKQSVALVFLIGTKSSRAVLSSTFSS
jgi:hypothetical protein